jgi:hypothetical protein
MQIPRRIKPPVYPPIYAENTPLHHAILSAKPTPLATILSDTFVPIAVAYDSGSTFYRLGVAFTICLCLFIQLLGAS